jgi:hypothetical protein
VVRRTTRTDRGPSYRRPQGLETSCSDSLSAAGASQAAGAPPDARTSIMIERATKSWSARRWRVNPTVRREMKPKGSFGTLVQP